VTAYDIEERAAFFFRSRMLSAIPRYDFSMVEVARATSAAPTYFEPVEVTDAAGARRYALIDGGVFAVTRPCARTSTSPTRARSSSSPPWARVSSRDRSHTARPAGGASSSGARPLIDVVFDGAADTVEFQLERLLPANDHIRLQVQLRRANDDLDDASDENLARAAPGGHRAHRRPEQDIDVLWRAVGGASGGVRVRAEFGEVGG
jgi:hypothetical protein